MLAISQSRHLPGYRLIWKGNLRKNNAKQSFFATSLDRIASLGMPYFDGGFVMQDERVNLEAYLYRPCPGLEGNGIASRIMDEV
jgi:hypothetical protein